MQDQSLHCVLAKIDGTCTSRELHQANDIPQLEGITGFKPSCYVLFVVPVAAYTKVVLHLAFLIFYSSCSILSPCFTGQYALCMVYTIYYCLQIRHPQSLMSDCSTFWGPCRPVGKRELIQASQREVGAVQSSKWKKFTDFLPKLSPDCRYTGARFLSDGINQ